MMATGSTFTHISQRTKTLKTLKQTHTKVLKTSNLAFTMLLVQGENSQKNIAFYVPVDCAKFTIYRRKMYSRNLFTYSGLGWMKLVAIA